MSPPADPRVSECCGVAYVASPHGRGLPPQLPHHTPECPNAEKPRKQTCECCRKVRLCWRKNRYFHYCRECWPLSDEERREKRKASPPKKRTPLAYPCIGGPLDGQHAVTTDFYRESGEPEDRWYRPPGLYAHLSGEYLEYNAASGGRSGPRIGGHATMIFVHKSCLKPLISGRNR